jgi:uncharacterized protein (DUF736 family)
MELKENAGVLFNNNFSKSERSPDLTGELKINGIIYKIAGWNNNSKSGKSYISLKISEKQDNFQTANSPNNYSQIKRDEPRENKENFSDDDIF